MLPPFASLPGFLTGWWLSGGWRALGLSEMLLCIRSQLGRGSRLSVVQSQKPNHQPVMDTDREQRGRGNGAGLVWSLRLWDSSVFSWTVVHFVCVCLLLCEDDTAFVSPRSIVYVRAREDRKQLYLVVRLFVPTISSITTALSGFSVCLIFA